MHYLCPGVFQSHRRHVVVSSPGMSLLLSPYPSFGLNCWAIPVTSTTVLLIGLWQPFYCSIWIDLFFMSWCLSASIPLSICQCLSHINELVCLVMLHDNEGRWCCSDFLQFSQFLSGSVWAMQQLTFTLPLRHSLVSWTSSFRGVALFSSFVES